MGSRKLVVGGGIRESSRHWCKLQDVYMLWGGLPDLR